MSDDSAKKIQLIQDLAAIAYELGWVMSLPMGDGIVEGLIIGELEFTLETSTIIYGEDKYEVYTQVDQDEGLVELHTSPKKTTWH